MAIRVPAVDGTLGSKGLKSKTVIDTSEDSTVVKMWDTTLSKVEML